jgi:hypothetical protein
MNEEIKLNNTKEGWDVASPLGRIQRKTVCVRCANLRKVTDTEHITILYGC